MLKRSTSWVHMAVEPSYFDRIVKIIIEKRYMNLMMAHDRGSEFGFCVTQFILLVDIIAIWGLKSKYNREFQRKWERVLQIKEIIGVVFVYPLFFWVECVVLSIKTKVGRARVRLGSNSIELILRFVAYVGPVIRSCRCMHVHKGRDDGFIVIPYWAEPLFHMITFCFKKKKKKWLRLLV